MASSSSSSSQETDGASVNSLIFPYSSSEDDSGYVSESTVEGPFDEERLGQLHSKKPRAVRVLNPSSAASGAISLVPVPPPFNSAVVQEMGGKPPVFVFEKSLTSGDVSAAFNRLFITKGWRVLFALETREKQILNEEGDYLRVFAADTNGSKFQLHLSRSGLQKSMSLVLDHEWSKFVTRNRLKEGDTVQGWGYRVRGEFRLALSGYSQGMLIA